MTVGGEKTEISNRVTIALLQWNGKKALIEETPDNALNNYKKLRGLNEKERQSRVGWLIEMAVAHAWLIYDAIIRI